MGDSAVGPPRHPDLLWVSRGGALCNLLQTLCRAARLLGWAPFAGAAFYFLFFFLKIKWSFCTPVCSSLGVYGEGKSN